MIRMVVANLFRPGYVQPLGRKSATAAVSKNQGGSPVSSGTVTDVALYAPVTAGHAGCY